MKTLFLFPNWKTLLSALFIVLAFPPWNFSFLIWFALIPWFSALDKYKGERKALKKGLVLGVWQGVWLSFFMTLGGFYWVAYSLHEFGVLPWSLSIAALLLFSLGSQPQFIIFALLRVYLKKTINWEAGWKSLTLVSILAFAYTGLDWILPKIFLDTLGHSLYLSRYLNQSADIGGAHLLTFIIYFSNETLYQFIKSRKKPFTPQFITGILLFSLNFIYGYYRSHQIEKIMTAPHPTLQMGVIQANIGDFDKIAAENGVRGAAEKVLSTFFRLSDQALTLDPKPEVLVWPETSYPSTFRTPQTLTEFQRDQELQNYVRARGVPLLFGGYDHSDSKDFNAFFFLSPHPLPAQKTENDLQVYRKNILLLFGEYIPGYETFDFIKNNFPQVGNFGRGIGPEVLKIYSPQSGPILVNPIICYEALFSNFILDAVRKGSQIILNITNDSWFGPYGEPDLHLALTVFRSLESRRPQVRSTNTGISALILPDGSMTNRSQINREEIVNMTVPILPSIQTLMLKWGDWFGKFALILGLLGIFFAVFPYIQLSKP